MRNISRFFVARLLWHFVKGWALIGTCSGSAVRRVCTFRDRKNSLWRWPRCLSHVKLRGPMANCWKFTVQLLAFCKVTYCALLVSLVWAQAWACQRGADCFYKDLGCMCMPWPKIRACLKFRFSMCAAFLASAAHQKKESTVFWHHVLIEHAMGRSKGIVEVHLEPPEVNDLAAEISKRMPDQHRGAVGVDATTMFGHFATKSA